MFLLESCKKSTILLGQSIGQQALISGVTDVIIVKYPNGQYHSTPFIVCFGSHSVLNRDQNIQILANKTTRIQTKNKVNRHGYMDRSILLQQQIRQLNLQYGLNKITYILGKFQIQAEVYMLKITDKILISDFDGTLTKNDFGGLIGNILDYDYVHNGYKNLMHKLLQKGVFLVWVTMRSLPLYEMSKQYLHKYIGIQGVMLMQPEQFFPAVKKELFKKTGNIKTNIIKSIGNLYPSGVLPIVGGLGNRQNDAIAYLKIGMSQDHIYLVSTKGFVQRMSSANFGLTYSTMADNINQYFRLYTYFF